MKLVPPWLPALMERIEQARRDGTAALLDSSSHKWASDIVQIFSDNAVDHLIRDYVTYAVGRYKNVKADNRKRALILVASDASLNNYDRVRLVLAKIACAYDDMAYLRGLDRRIARWRLRHDSDRDID